MRRLYPGASIRLPGGVNRNVRAFIALHADALDIHDPSRVELDAVERVIVVDAAQLNRLGDAAEVIERPGVEVSLFDHHAHGPAPDWVSPGEAVISADGALATTMVGILAERGIEPTPPEATALALGIHEDTGSLTHLTTTPRDIEALAWCVHHGADQPLVAEFLRTPLSHDQRDLLSELMDAAVPHDARGHDRADRRHELAAPRHRSLDPGQQDRGADRRPRAGDAWSRWTAACSPSAAAAHR